MFKLREGVRFFSAHLDGEVLHVRFKKNLLEHLADLSKRDMIFRFANQVSKSCDVKVILLNSDFRETGCEAYTKFFLKEKRTRDLIDLHKVCNITSQVVLGLMGLDQVVIHTCQGNVISLFLNISLACDYRIAADNSLFCNPYLDLGMIPGCCQAPHELIHAGGILTATRMPRMTLTSFLSGCGHDSLKKNMPAFDL